MSDLEDHTQKTPAGQKRERSVKQPNEPQFVAGDMIAGVYEVVSFIGSGGMSNVYKCKDISLDRIVAVKALQSGFTDDSLRRFQTEGKAIAKLEHPNIVKLYGLQTGDNDEPVLVMEYIPGATLSDILKKNANLSTDRVLKITTQICEALKASEHAGIVHRDLKPSNIMLTNPGAVDEGVKILDFGIAKIRDNTAGDVTKTGDIFGTPNYMSPEQALGKKCDARADQYALGCILFEMLSGRPPFTSENILSVILMHVQNPAPPLAEVTTKHLPSNLTNIVKKMLQKRPEDRYPGFEEVADALLTVGKKSASASRKLVVYSVLPVLLTLLVLFFVYTIQTRTVSHMIVNQLEKHGSGSPQKDENAEKVAVFVDKDLNEQYGAVMEKFGGNSALKEKIISSEKAWMAFRDAHLQAIYPDEDGTKKNPFAGSACYEEAFAETTVIRTRQLSHMLAGPIAPVSDANEKLKRVESFMNETYQKALRNYGPESPNILRQAQMKWLAFREAESNLLSTLARPGETESVKLSTKENLARLRTIELLQWVKGVKEDKVCAGTRPVADSNVR